MANVILIHGTYGNPQENWFPWLEQELTTRRITVTVPTFPTPANQSLKSWMKVFEKYRPQINEDTIFVGHSLGPAFILQILQSLECSVKAAFFVSGFVDLLNNDTFDELNKTFVDTQFDWPLIQNHCANFFVYHSDNDPYVPMHSATKLAKHVHTHVITVPKAGHFNLAAGYSRFPKLLEDIVKASKVT